MNKYIRLSSEVTAARAAGKPIVALESTIVAHGMPYPHNLELARTLEELLRAQGVTPATIAVASGVVKVGLSADELKELAQARGVRKLSRADLAHCLHTGEWGATTVAATMLCAQLAGISVFATGGIGGVHFDVAESFDISADLAELARTPVLVVAAGAKAILDIAKSLEVLESLGVPVLVYRSSRFPAFWSRDSGSPAPLRVESAAEIAKMHRIRQDLGLRSGQLIANPIPLEAEITSERLQPWIQAAWQAARKEGISGKQVTPYLLKSLVQASDGASLQANIALVRNNVALAGEIARELSYARAESLNCRATDTSLAARP